ncbi:MAG: uroporphyrinogen decarboxylase [bacterium]
MRISRNSYRLGDATPRIRPGTWLSTVLLQNMTHFDPEGQSEISKRERFLKAIRKEPVDRPPVWMMRQAGRYLPQYQKLKERYSFKDLCRIPDLAAEISIQPFDIFDVDAIIVFNDILVPFEHMGFSVAFTDLGPEIQPAMRSEEMFANMHRARFDETPPVVDALQRVRKRVGPDVPIIGFIGGPFTMAAYAVEGHVTKNFTHIKALRYRNPDLFRRLLDCITETVIDYLSIQIEAGADVVQIFDTWAGILTPADYREFALPFQKRIIQTIREKSVPVILYVNGCAPYLTAMGQSGADVLSVDWRVDLKSVYNDLGGCCAVQGNLDPTMLCADPDTVAACTQAMLDGFGHRSGHIANLGHGVLPNSLVESVHAFVETVQKYKYGDPTHSSRD